MTLVFLGTRGDIGIRSRRHRRHTSTAVCFGRRRVVIDRGDDWRPGAGRLDADAIVITHAHPDHAGALRLGAPCPVYATAAAWDVIGRWPIRDRRTLHHWMPRRIGGITFEAVPVAHSLRAPAVGYRITAGRTTVFYVPDVASLPDAARALRGVSLYIGDGASISRPILRKRGAAIIGHASIAAQLGWCALGGVRLARFTHCGSQIVRGPHRRADERVAALGRAHGVNAAIVCDGQTLRL